MGSKSVTTGYWYLMTFHFGLCRGPVDALTEFRGGDRVAWAGAADSSQEWLVFTPLLWGGPETEGGIAGPMNLFMGEPDQPLHPQMAAWYGADQGAYRGRTTVMFRGAWGANNPYPKPAAFKVRRIKKGWDGDACWYPTKAEIPLGSGGTHTTAGHFGVLEPTPGGTGAAPGVIAPMTGTPAEIGQAAVDARNAAYIVEFGPDAQQVYMTSAHYNGTSIVAVGNDAENTYPPGTGVASVAVSMVCPAGYAATSPDGQGVVCTLAAELKGMNPAHMLYDSITSQDMMGEPVAAVDDASFRAAADKLFDEGFGLCTTYDATAESIESFQARICNVISAALTRDRRTGLWCLDLMRGGGNPALLPVLTDDDILDFSSEPSTLDDAANQVVVEWFDVVRKETRSTSPVQALGLIQAFGGVVAESLSYPEIPVETLALRAADRDLRKKATPLRRFELKTTRTPYAWRAGTYFRLVAPKRGIAGMTCLVGEIDVGTLRRGAISLTAVEDVFSMPDSVYIEPQQPPESGDGPPAAPQHQRMVEAPYAELARYPGVVDVGTMPADEGRIMAMGSRPARGWNYSLATAAAGEDYVERALCDWTPICVVDEGAGHLDGVVHFSSQIGLSPLIDGIPGLPSGGVEAPVAALWDDEIIRIDALDIASGTLTVARGCMDTVPAEHAAGSVIFVFGAMSGSDERAYSDGEAVSAKLLSRSAGAQLSLAGATVLTAEMASRQVRPYPPGAMLIGGEPYPDAVAGTITVTWAHRDRVLQSDQLVDTTMASIGPEAGTTYSVELRRIDTDAVLDSLSGVTGTSADLSPGTYTGELEVRLWSVRDGMSSWQQHVHRLAQAHTRITENGAVRTTEDGDTRVA